MFESSSSINKFWSIFDEPICIDGKEIPKPKSTYDEEFLRKYAPEFLAMYKKYIDKNYSAI
jgi:hypothetical protein